MTIDFARVLFDYIRDYFRVEEVVSFDYSRSIRELEDLHFWLSHRNKAEMEN
jgi:hypothetical protein